MKHIILRIFLGGLASFFFLNTQVFSQESSTSNSGQLEVVLPNYQYEYIPDFTYEEVAGRIEKMELEMDFELNDRMPRICAIIKKSVLLSPASCARLTSSSI